MLDVVSAVASLATLIEVTSQLVEFLSDLKDGDRDRRKLLAEVASLCCALENLKELLESDSASFKIDNKTEEESMREVRSLALLERLLEQYNGITSSIKKQLALKEGKARAIQHLRWPFSKADVLQAVEELHRLQATVNNILSWINISLPYQI